MTEKKNWDYDAKTYSEMKRQQLQDAYQTIDETTKEVLADDESFKKFLDMQSGMERYSIANLLLIHNQNPTASLIRGFDDWSKDEISIKKGEKGISVLQPYSYEKDGQQKTGYKLKKVFDINQTVAESPLLPERNIPLKYRVLELLVDNSPVEIDGTDKEEILQGKDTTFFASDQKIYIRKGMESEEFMVKVMEEVASVRLCSGEDVRNVCEPKFLAKCITYMICKQTEIVQYVPEIHVPEKYRELEPKDVRKELTKMNQTYREMKKEILYPEKKREHDRER